MNLPEPSALATAAAAAPPSLARVALPEPLAPAELWPRLARCLSHWAATQGLPLRDLVWLLPFSALLPQARRALAAQGGWQPRVETPQTLARQIGRAHV
jgi:hypothetical protein